MWEVAAWKREDFIHCGSGAGPAPGLICSPQTSRLNVELSTTYLGAGRSHDLGSLVNINDDSRAQ